MKIASSLLLVVTSLVAARIPEAAPTPPAPPPVLQRVTGHVDFRKNGKVQASDEGYVYLERVFRGRHVAPKPKSESIEQKNQTFTPNLMVIPVNSTVAFPNNDLPGKDHNVFSPTAPPFDLSRYSPPISKSQNFDFTGDFDIYCDIHPNMEAVIKVVDSDLIACVENGDFVIHDVPPGEYKLVAWAPNNKQETRQTILVTAGKDLAVPDRINVVMLGTPKQAHLKKDNITPYPVMKYNKVTPTGVRRRCPLRPKK